MPRNELERLKAVNRFFKLEISKENELQEIVDLAAETCQTQIAIISLIDEDVQHILFKTGTDADTITRLDTFCHYTIQQDEVMVVPDAQLDKRFAKNPFVSGVEGIRFYAGAPIRTQDGYNLGTLCLVDQVPRELTSSQLRMLQVLSKQVTHLLEFDASLKTLKELYVEAKSAEIQLRSYFESSSSCHLLLDKDLVLMDFNKAAVVFAANTYQVKLVTGMHANEYVHPSYAQNYLANCKQTLEGKVIELERQINYNGDAMWWQMNYEPARNKDGEITGVSYNSTNITNRKEQELKIIAQNESLKKIAYMQSHELCKPVASIMGLMNIFKSDDYMASREDLLVMEKAVNELDEKIRVINRYAEHVQVP